MRHTLLLAASTAALMAGSAWAQEEPAPATEPAEAPAVAATDEPAAATDAQVVTTTEGGDAAGDAAIAGASPMQALTLAAEQLQTVAQQMQGAGTGATTDGTAGGVTGDATGDATAGLTTTEDPAAGTTDTTTDGATVVTTTTGGGNMQMQQEATDALDQFDQAVQQVGGSPDGEAAQEQIAQIQQQSQLVRQQLEEDPQVAAEGMQELAQAALQVQTAQIPADADAIIGKQLVSSDGEEAGQVTDILITAAGQVEALVVERGGALGLGGQKVAIQWDQVQIQGDQLLVNLPADQIEQMPEYQVD